MSVKLVLAEGPTSAWGCSERRREIDADDCSVLSASAPSPRPTIWGTDSVVARPGAPLVSYAITLSAA